MEGDTMGALTQTRTPARTRLAAVAGRFYPADPQALRAEVDGYLAPSADHVIRAAHPVAAEGAARAPRKAWPKLLLVPHAGYVYSGPIAGTGYARLAAARGRITRVVLLGPTHRVAVRGIALPACEAFVTPLGTVPVDQAALTALADLPQVVVSDAAHTEEHALEVQLPFLQAVLGSFALVPLAVGRATADEVAAVIERLWGGEETLIVISSDLSHYLPYDEARARDRATIERVLKLDPRLDHDEACGATPLAGALIAARRHGLRSELLDLRNSGDTAGDRRQVVGYAAVAFWDWGRAQDAAAARGSSDATSTPERALGSALLAHAREAIAAELGLAIEPAPEHPGLAAPGATFVTLRCDGALRGCIGRLKAERLLRDDVRRNAVAAALADPRFQPLSRAEFERIQVEVSLLDVPVPLAVASEAEAQAVLRPFEDGVVLEWQGHRATFLPQVWELLPTASAFLGALKRKAGLPADFWAPDLRLARYRVRKFAAPDAAPEPEETS